MSIDTAPEVMADPHTDDVAPAVCDLAEERPEWEGQSTVPRFPDVAISEATAVTLLLSLYTVLAIFMPASLDIKADPAVTPVGSRPEWYFLFLNAFLHYAPPLVGTVVPLAGVVFLIALPWLDRNPSRRLGRRPIALAAGAIVVVGLIGLSILGYMEREVTLVP